MILKHLFNEAANCHLLYDTRRGIAKAQVDMEKCHNQWKDTRHQICHEYGYYRRVKAREFDDHCRFYRKWLEEAYVEAAGVVYDWEAQYY